MVRERGRPLDPDVLPVLDDGHPAVGLGLGHQRGDELEILGAVGIGDDEEAVVGAVRPMLDEVVDSVAAACNGPGRALGSSGRDEPRFAGRARERVDQDHAPAATA